jgi:hypothetical protein
MNEELIGLDDELFSPLTDEEKAMITGATGCKSDTACGSVANTGPVPDYDTDVDIDWVKDVN